ncbi:hypothetical protein MLD38_027860 [Melastoma candidum]|uniref:Uncharacterized protein n=1 Tax=Melastoma candidum TaxID=119954 RepID=A0ACB9MZF2_9MYRT|nr:hypothetical protein MLD38_027860 [Melastoma candidum]
MYMTKGWKALNASRGSEEMAKKGSKGKGKAKQATSSKKKVAGCSAGNVGESSTNLNSDASMGLGTKQNPIVFDEDGVWVNLNPTRVEEEVDPEHLRIYEEMLKRWMENPPMENVDWSETSSDYETEPSEEEFDPKELPECDALELITSAIVDNSRRPRPPALTSPVIRGVMAQLDQIDTEQSPMQRLKKCRELWQLLGQIEGVPNYIGDLHEELYTLALLDAPDTSWQPDPVVPASPTSGSSTEGELWLDERDDYPPSSPDQEPSWSDD